MEHAAEDDPFDDDDEDDAVVDEPPHPAVKRATVAPSDTAATMLTFTRTPSPVEPTDLPHAKDDGLENRWIRGRAVEYRLLGSLTVIRDGVALPLGGLRQRAVLAALLLAGDRAVDADRLIDQVWGENAPPKPLVSLRAYVTNLRHIIGANAAVRTGSGYRIDTSATWSMRASSHGSSIRDDGCSTSASQPRPAPPSRTRSRCGTARR